MPCCLIIQTFNNLSIRNQTNTVALPFVFRYFVRCNRTIVNNLIKHSSYFILETQRDDKWVPRSPTAFDEPRELKESTLAVSQVLPKG